MTSRLALQLYAQRTLPRVAAVLVYALALHWSYAVLISPSYDYMGMSYRTPEILTYVGMLVAVLVLATALPATITRLSDFVLWVVFLVTAAPSALMAQYMDTLPVNRATVLGLMILSTLLLIRLALLVAPREIVRARPLSPRVFFGALSLFAEVDLRG